MRWLLFWFIEGKRAQSSALRGLGLAHPTAAEKQCNELFQKMRGEYSEFDRSLHQALLAMGGKLTFSVEAANAAERTYRITLDWKEALDPEARDSPAVPSSPPRRSNLVAQCPVCWEERTCIALSPCGHLVCTKCPSFNGKPCPVCTEFVVGEHNIFSASASAAKPPSAAAHPGIHSIQKPIALGP